MRNENSLNVNVRLHAERAAQRTGSTGIRLQEALQSEEPQSSWRESVLKFLARVSPSNWERVIVNNSVDSVTMPKWIASAILLTVLGFGIQSWWARSADHDALIEIRTELRLAKEDGKEKELKAESTTKETDARIEGRLNDIAAWQGVMNGNYREILGMLKPGQASSLKKVPGQ